MSLSQRVATERKKKGLTQEELADLTNLTVRTIQRIESDETSPRLYTLKAIAAALEIPFEDLNRTMNQQELADSNMKVPAVSSREDSINFLQLFCLSCFSYLVVPMLHFLLPYYLLKKRIEQNPEVVAYARRLIKIQVYWVVLLNLLLLLTVAYNLFCSIYWNVSYTISYLVPFFIMYFINAFIISGALIQLKAKKFSYSTPV